MGGQERWERLLWVETLSRASGCGRARLLLRELAQLGVRGLERLRFDEEGGARRGHVAHGASHLVLLLGHHLQHVTVVAEARLRAGECVRLELDEAAELAPRCRGDLAPRVPQVAERRRRAVTHTARLIEGVCDGEAQRRLLRDVLEEAGQHAQAAAARLRVDGRTGTWPVLERLLLLLHGRAARLERLQQVGRGEQRLAGGDDRLAVELSALLSMPNVWRDVAEIAQINGLGEHLLERPHLLHLAVQ